MARQVLDRSTIFRSLHKWPRHLRKEILTRKTPRGQPAALQVTSYRALVRVISFFWYCNQNSVLLRGQTKCHGNLLSSAHRSTAVPRLVQNLDKLIDEFRTTTGFDPAPEQRFSTEPMLQHYGLRTRWLDFVDSIPHALFFATNQLVNSPFPEGTKSTYLPSPHGEGLIYVVDVGRLRPHVVSRQVVAGMHRTDWGGLVCDLRRAKPGLVMRPHAQHGWLVRPPPSKPNLWERMLLPLYFDVRLARRWLEGAESLDRESLFPDPSWDDMYRSLLTGPVSKLFERQRLSGHDIGEVTTFDFHS